MNREEDDESPPPPDPPNIPFPSIGLPPRSRPVSLPPPLPYSRVFLDHSNPSPAPILFDWDHRVAAVAAAAAAQQQQQQQQPLPSIPFSPTTPSHMLPFSPAQTSPSLSHFSSASHHPISVPLQQSQLQLQQSTHQQLQPSAPPLPLQQQQQQPSSQQQPQQQQQQQQQSQSLQQQPDQVQAQPQQLQTPTSLQPYIPTTTPVTTTTGIAGPSTRPSLRHSVSTPRSNEWTNTNTGIFSAGTLPSEPALPPLSHMLSTSTSPSTQKPSGTARIPSARGGVRKRALQHSCHLCSYRAHQSSDLKRHLATHQDLRPFRCPDCDHSFRQKAHLNAHRLAIHSRLKPHRCDVCSRTFAARSSLKRHVTYVHNKHPPFFCPHCPAQFQRVFDCSRHQAAMHPRARGAAVFPPPRQPATVEQARLVRSPSLPVASATNRVVMNQSLFLDSANAVAGRGGAIALNAARGMPDTIDGLLAPTALHQFGAPGVGGVAAVTGATLRSNPMTNPLQTAIPFNAGPVGQITRTPSLPHITRMQQGAMAPFMHRSASATVVGRPLRQDQDQEQERPPSPPSTR